MPQAQSTTKKGPKGTKRKGKQVATRADFSSEDNLIMHEMYNKILDTPARFRNAVFNHVAEEVGSPLPSRLYIDV